MTIEDRLTQHLHSEAAAVDVTLAVEEIYADAGARSLRHPEQRTQRKGLLAATAAIALVAGASGIHLLVRNGTSTQINTTAAPATIATEHDDRVTNSGRFFDESLPLGQLEVSWPLFQDVPSLVKASDLVFTGRIIGSTQNVYGDDPSLEVPDSSKFEYDGIVFEVEELLKGRPPNDSDQITVAHYAVFRRDGREPQRLEVRPIQVVEPGLRAAELGVDGPIYLVFVVRSDDDESVLLFNTDGGVVTIAGGGELVGGIAAPLRTSGVNAADPVFLDDIRRCASGHC